VAGERSAGSFLERVDREPTPLEAAVLAHKVRVFFRESLANLAFPGEFANMRSLLVDGALK
jgi:hypothetical protein